MIKLNIQHQEEYSRGELLLRTFFGVFYMVLPHVLAIFIFAIGAMFLHFLTFWVTLFTGKYPQNWFNYQVNLMRWSIRLNARMNNLTDGYPAFGMNGSDDKTSLSITYPEKVNQGLVLIRVLFGVLYVNLPHGICLMFRGLAGMFITLIAFWIVLFTGKYPVGMHKFQVDTMRWSLRVQAYMFFMTDTYPPFTGAPDEGTDGLLDN